MQIFNVRFGHANNSSSSHSMILLKDRTARTDETTDFGWQYFTVADERTKVDYLAALVFDALRRVSTGPIAEAAVQNLFDTPANFDWKPQGGTPTYIDHQSVITIPLSWDGEFINEQFLKEFRDFLMQDDLVILGGNDNDDHTHPLATEDNPDFTLALPYDNGSKDWVARKDTASGRSWWTLFNRSSGDKMRFDFGLAGVNNVTHNEHYWSGRRSGHVDEPTKAQYPELVDIKITDFCPFECAFCYQGSDRNGKHADQSLISTYLRDLGKMKCFEIAIGGGEPTMHPAFMNILHAARHNGIVPNFTTKSFEWMRDHPKADRIVEACGSFAFSIDNVATLEKLHETCISERIPKGKISIQIIPDLVGERTLKSILDAVLKFDFNKVTLLGWKDSGRGLDYRNSTPSYIMKKNQVLGEWVLPKLFEWNDDEYRYGFSVSIDTVLAAQSQAQLAELNVPRWLYFTSEGKWSMYIDAVSEKAGASSFVPDSEMTNLELDNHSYFESIANIFYRL